MTAPSSPASWRRLAAGTVGAWTWRVGTRDLFWDDAQRELMGAADGESPAHCWARVVLPGEAMRATAVGTVWREVSTYRISAPAGPPGTPGRTIMDRVTDSWTDPADGSLWLRGISLDVSAWPEPAPGSGVEEVDVLTALASEARILELGEEHLAADPDGDVGLLVVNLDRFTLVNDALGRDVGDDLLREVVRRLALVCDPSVVLGRVGGDEFLALLPRADMTRAEAVAASITRALRQSVVLAGQQVTVSASVGVASTAVPCDDRSMTRLRRDVDLAVHEAKRLGGDRWVRCEEELRESVAAALRMDGDLREALERTEQLALHYQPAFSLSTGRPVGVEGLLRWTHPVRGMVPPLEVVGNAERSGLIVPLGAWVLDAAVEQASRWRDLPDFTTWFNVSPRQLVDGDLPGRLLRALGAAGLPACRIGIEVTESVFADGSPALAVIEEIQDFGVRIAIDDFGTGYSSLSRLLTMPVDLVKIDRSFVEAGSTAAGHAVLEGVITLAHGIGAVVIAEGVETADQLRVLRELGCDEVAGYLFSRPRLAPDVPLGRLDLPALLGATPARRSPVSVSG